MEKRSMQNVVTHTGASMGSVKAWSTRHAWQSRSKQYDATNDMAMISTIITDLEDARRSAVDVLGTQLAVTDKLLAVAMEASLKLALDEGQVSIDQITAYLKAIALSDTLRRRMLSMPTSFKSETSDDDFMDGRKYTISE